MTSSVPASARTRTAATQQFLVTFAGIFALIGLLLVLDFFLARIDKSETSQHAANLYNDGRDLLARGKAADAADQLATAVSLDRNNLAYGLALAQALIADGQLQDAETLLNTLLLRAPNDGAVSLTMAHLLVQSKRPDDARAFYHRAIYGRWGRDSTEQRMRARLELIGLLSRQGAREELLAELLPLQGMSGDSTMLLRTVAPLYLQAGSPERASVIYRELLRREPGDLSAYMGLTDADMAQGQMRTARSDLVRAAREFPNDTTIDRKVKQLDSAFSLDPNARGLTDTERLRRSGALLERTLFFLSECDSQPATPEQLALQDSARSAIQATKPRAPDESLLERRLSLFDSLWEVVSQSCPVGSGSSVPGLVQRLTKG